MRKTVTALFCDLVGSTALGERYDPEVLRPHLHAYFEEMRAVVEHHGGRVEKFVGDAVNAVFGLPVAHEDDALRAVRAGAEMVERLDALTAGGSIPLACRIGVNTGEVFVPEHGEPLIGDTMNTAARLQATAEPGSILIGESTWRLVRDVVVAQPVGLLVLKGKAHPLSAYRVTEVAWLAPMRTRRLDGPMVGRQREKMLLAQAYERCASERACRRFTLLGAAGVGKSRLVEEFLAGLKDAEVLRGRCLAYGAGITWYAITEALRGALELPAFAEAATVRAAIHEAVAGEHHSGALEANLAPLFAVGPAGTAEQTGWAIRRFLESRSRTRPLILVLDDIHWADPALLDLVEQVADRSSHSPILMVCMARPDLLDERPGWGDDKPNAAAIWVAPLTNAETGALVDGLLGPSDLAPEVRSRITEISEGNPLFVEEILRMLVDDGRLVRDSGRWVVTEDVANIRVPLTVSALLSARLDMLSEAERAIIQAASVAGKEFHRGAVAALLPNAERPRLATHLRSLIRKDLVASDRSNLPGEDAYRFRHLLIRDAAYGALPKAERSGLHTAFADWLAATAGERLAEQQAIVGYHLERAYRYREELGLPEDSGLRLRAAKALGEAGARALDLGDIRGAVDLLRPATQLAAGDPAVVEMLHVLAIAYNWGGPHSEYELALARLKEEAARFASPVLAAQARQLEVGESAFEHPDTLDYDAAVRRVEGALQTFREHGATQFEPGALLWLSNLAWSRGDSAASLRHARQALELAARHGPRLTVSWAVHNVLANLVRGATPLGEALAQAEAYRERFAGDPWVDTVALNSVSQINAMLGRPGPARVAAAAFLESADALGLASRAADSAVQRGYLEWFDGDVAEAVTRFTVAMDAWEAAGDRLNQAWIGPDLARAMIDLERIDEAEAIMRPLADNRAFAGGVAIRSIEAVIAAHRGHRGPAIDLADEVAAVAARTDFLMIRGDVALDRAEVLRLACRPADARDSAADALDTYERKGYPIGIRRTREMLGRLPR